MGFESSQGARRRLAAMAARKEWVKDAVQQHPLSGAASAPDGAVATPAPAVQQLLLAQQLEHLAHEIVATPGAGGALLAAYAAQARALTMLVEAARRAGNGPLPPTVLAAAQEALEMKTPMPGLAIA